MGHYLARNVKNENNSQSEKGNRKLEVTVCIMLRKCVFERTVPTHGRTQLDLQPPDLWHINSF